MAPGTPAPPPWTIWSHERARAAPSREPCWSTVFTVPTDVLSFSDLCRRRAHYRSATTCSTRDCFPDAAAIHPFTLSTLSTDLIRARQHTQAHSTSAASSAGGCVGASRGASRDKPLSRMPLMRDTTQVTAYHVSQEDVDSSRGSGSCTNTAMTVDSVLSSRSPRAASVVLCVFSTRTTCTSPDCPVLAASSMSL